MLYVEVLIFKFATVDRLSLTYALILREIATLEHVFRQNASDHSSLVVKLLFVLANAFLSGTKRTEVFNSLRYNVSEETEDETVLFFLVDHYVKEDLYGVLARLDSFLHFISERLCARLTLYNFLDTISNFLRYCGIAW